MPRIDDLIDLLGKAGYLDLAKGSLSLLMLAKILLFPLPWAFLSLR